MKFAFGLGALFITFFNIAWIVGLIWIAVHFIHKFW